MFNHAFIHFCINIRSYKRENTGNSLCSSSKIKYSTLSHRKHSDWSSCSWSFVCSECVRVRVFVICLLFATLNRMMHEIKIGKMNRANGISALLIERWLNNSETLYPLSRPLLLKWAYSWNEFNLKWISNREQECEWLYWEQSTTATRNANENGNKYWKHVHLNRFER